MTDRPPTDDTAHDPDEHLDARLRGAFGEPPDFRAIADHVVTRTQGFSLRHRWHLAAAAAAVVVLGAALTLHAFFGSVNDAHSVDAGAIWNEINPTTDCRAPKITRSDELAQHCSITHGTEVRVDVGSPASVHGPTKCRSLPKATVLTIVYPARPGEPPEVRTVLVGRDIAIRSSKHIHAFLRELNGVALVELTTSTAARALSLFY